MHRELMGIVSSSSWSAVSRHHEPSRHSDLFSLAQTSDLSSGPRTAVESLHHSGLIVGATNKTVDNGGLPQIETYLCCKKTK